MKVCIPKDIAEAVQKTITATMNTAERQAAFESILKDKNLAHEINKRFEATKLLKNQTNADAKFLEKMMGSEKSLKRMDALKKEAARKLAKIYNPDGTINENFGAVLSKSEDEINAIAEKAYAQKYRVDIPETIKIKQDGVETEVDTIQHLTKMQDEVDSLATAAKGTVDDSEQKLAWGYKLVEMQKVLEGIQHAQKSYTKDIRLALSNIKTQLGQGDITGGIGSTASGIIDLAFTPTIKSIKASLDHSVLFRQGLKVLSANKGIWAKNAKQSSLLWTKAFSPTEEQAMVDAFKASMMTKDIYQEAVDAKLAIGVIEDFFPKSPVSGLLGFRTSDEVFTMFSQGSRMDLFESYVNLYKKANADAMPSKEIMKDFAKVANSVTGRGGLGSAEASAGFWNKILFSARYQTANINTVRHAFSPSIAPEARKIAQRQLAQHLALIGGVMTTLSAFGDVGWDPRASTFGKVRLNGSKKWVDVTGGLGSYIALIGKSAKAITGKQKYGQDTALDIVTGFMQGKLAPFPGVIRDYLEQRDYSGKKPTFTSGLESYFVPITIENIIQDTQKNTETDTAVLSFILEFLGNSVTQPKVKNFGSQWSPLDTIKQLTK